MAHKTEAGEAVVLISASWICRYSTHLVQPYITTCTWKVDVLVQVSNTP